MAQSAIMTRILSTLLRAVGRPQGDARQDLFA